MIGAWAFAVYTPVQKFYKNNTTFGDNEMPIQAKADNNVPFREGRSYFQILGTSPSWVYHRMATGVAMTGVAPRTAMTDEAHTDPAISAGHADFANLTLGGRFTLLSAYGRPFVVKSVDNPQSATITLVDKDGNAIRTPPAAPFRVAPGEYLKAVTVTTGAVVGFYVHLDGEKVL